MRDTSRKCKLRYNRGISGEMSKRNFRKDLNERFFQKTFIKADSRKHACHARFVRLNVIRDILRKIHKRFFLKDVKRDILRSVQGKMS